MHTYIFDPQIKDAMCALLAITYLYMYPNVTYKFAHSTTFFKETGFQNLPLFFHIACWYIEFFKSKKIVQRRCLKLSHRNAIKLK